MFTRSRKRDGSPVQTTRCPRSQLKTKIRTALKHTAVKSKRTTRSKVRDSHSRSPDVFSFSETESERIVTYPDRRNKSTSRKRKLSETKPPKKVQRYTRCNNVSISPILVHSASKLNKNRSLNCSQVLFSEDSIRSVQNELEEYRNEIKSYKLPLKPSTPVNSSTPQNQPANTVNQKNQPELVIRCCKINVGSPALQTKPIQTSSKSVKKENDSSGYHTDESPPSDRQTNTSTKLVKDGEQSRKGNPNKKTNRSWRKEMEQKIMEKEQRYLKELNELDSFSLLIG